MRLHSYRDESHSRHFDLIGGGGHPWSIDLVSTYSFGHFGRGLRLCAHGPLGPLDTLVGISSQQASVRGPRGSEGSLPLTAPFDGLSPPPSEG